jgi:hypothetical protein
MLSEIAAGRQACGGWSPTRVLLEFDGRRLWTPSYPSAGAVSGQMSGFAQEEWC